MAAASFAAGLLLGLVAMSALTFNRTPLDFSRPPIEQPTDDEIRATPPLFNASLQDALLYGGDLTRAALSAMDIRGDREHVIVDTKVHMLMRGMWPAIPGWHTDGVPRPDGRPHIWLQESMRAPRFHLLVTGACLTDFYAEPLTLDVPDDPTTDLYALLSRQVAEVDDPSVVRVSSCVPVEWDWWHLHTAVRAPRREWRFLVRVTETDHRPPRADLRDVLRTQQQVYVESSEFGW